MRPLVCAALVALLVPAAARADGSLTRTVTVGGPVKVVSIRLPKTDYPAYDITLHGKSVSSVKVDLRHGSRSVGHPSIATCLPGVCNYSYSPQNTSTYSVVLTKAKGGPVKVSVKVGW